MNITTIRVTKETLKKLKVIGKKEETYDEIINRLLKYAKDSQNKD